MAVLEEIALKYFNSHDGRMLTYSLLFVLGGITATIVDRSEMKLTRWPFFIRGALIMVLMAVMQPIGRELAPAMMGGDILWVLMVVEVVTCAIAGYVSGLIAMARCRDGFGSNHKVLAIVAVAGIMLSRLAFFVLLLRGSRKFDEDGPSLNERASASRVALSNSDTSTTA